LTLEHLEKYVSNASQDESSQDITNLLQHIRGPWNEFKQYIDKYEKSMGKSTTKSKLGKAPRTILWAVNGISENMEKLRRRIEQPLQAVNSLLSLHVM
jgi:hypothetical protein